MSETPQTDAQEWHWEEDCTPEDPMIVPADFARKLERQCNDLAKANERYLPFVPDMEPIRAAKYSEANQAAWNLRQKFAKYKEASHE